VTADRIRVRRDPVRRLWASWVGRRWLLTRALTLLLLVPQTFETFGDLRYYYLFVNGLFHGGTLDAALREYPAPSVAVFALPRVFAGSHIRAYELLFVTLLLAIDAVFVTCLWRAAGRRPGPGITLWLWLLPLLGPLTLCRLDLVPAVLGGCALLVLARRPALAGALAAVGAAVKLWPAALVPAMWLRTPTTPRPARWRMLAAFAAVAAASCVIVVLIADKDRLVSPLTWQSDRSLQVESYAALPLLVGAVFSPGTWHVDFTKFVAFEVRGPGVQAMLTAASVATLVAVLLLAVLWLRAARLRVLPAEAIGWLATVTVSLVVITNKTLSPQYLLWIGAALAALGVTGQDPALRRATRLMLLTAALTQLFYPIYYQHLVDLDPFGVAAITVRDVTLLLLTWLAARRFWALTARPQPVPVAIPVSTESTESTDADVVSTEETPAGRQVR
jgi:Glycosyltransferase family 87